MKKRVVYKCKIVGADSSGIDGTKPSIMVEVPSELFQYEEVKISGVAWLEIQPDFATTEDIE